jgi:hypothetical protein
MALITNHWLKGNAKSLRVHFPTEVTISTEQHCNPLDKNVCSVTATSHSGDFKVLYLSAADLERLLIDLLQYANDATVSRVASTALRQLNGGDLDLVLEMFSRSR